MDKHLLTFLIVIGFGGSVLGQNIEGDTTVYNLVDIPAQPVNGMNQWYQEIARTIRYPASARKKGIMGKIFVSFIVNPDSTFSDFSILKGTEGDLSEEAIRTIHQASTIIKWSPGIKEGKPVRQRITFPITFDLPQKRK